MGNRKKERMIKNSFPWQEYFNVELKVYFFFFAFRVLIFTNAHYEKNEHNIFKYYSKRTKTKTKLHKRKLP